MLIKIKTRHFHSSINHQEHLFHITHITSYFRPVNIAKFLRTAFLKNTSRSSRLQMFFKIGVLRSVANFTGKHLCSSLFLKNFQAGGLQLHKKRLQHSCFPVKFAKSLRTPFLTEHLQWLLLHLRWLLLYFFKKTPSCDVPIIFPFWHIFWCIKSLIRLFINLLSFARFSK